MRQSFFLIIFSVCWLTNAHADTVVKNEQMQEDAKRLSSSEYYNAIKNNSFALVESLIGEGRDINVQDYSGKTPLMYAVQKEAPDIVKFLIGKGADVNLKTLNDVSALHYAARGDNSEVVRLLLENNADVNAVDFSGFTPFMRAVSTDNLKISKILLDAGANPFVANNNGQDSLDLVLSRPSKNSEIVFGYILNSLSFQDVDRYAQIQAKLDKYGNKDYKKMVEQKSVDVSSLFIPLVAAYNSDVSEISKLSVGRIAELPHFPCYELINDDLGMVNCITIAEAYAERNKLEQKAVVALDVEPVVEDIAVLPVKEGVKMAEVSVNVAIPVKQPDIMPIAKAVEKPAKAEIVKAPAVKAVAAAPMTGYSAASVLAPVNLVTRKDPAFYEQVIKENNVTVEELENAQVELSYISSNKWAYGDYAPTDIIDYRLVFKHYHNQEIIDAKYKLDQEYLQNQKKLAAQKKLETIVPVIKQSEKMKQPGFYIQSGSFIYPKNSTTLKKVLDKYGNVFIVEKLVKGRNFHIVYVGPFKTEAEALAVSKKKDFQKVIGVESFIRNF